MTVYTITWGKLSDQIPADSEAEAWAEFCRRNPDCFRHPKQFARTISVAAVGEPAPVSVPSPEPEPAIETSTTSPSVVTTATESTPSEM